jgi:type IV pilus assembly protein PilX
MKTLTCLNMKTRIPTPLAPKHNGSVLLISLVVLLILTNAFDTNGSDGLYDKSNLQLWKSLNWDTNDSIANSDFDSTYNISEPPRFIVQHLASISSSAYGLNLGNYGQNTGAGTVEVFLITARATGGSGTAPVILQTTYGKRL